LGAVGAGLVGSGLDEGSGVGVDVPVVSWQDL